MDRFHQQLLEPSAYQEKTASVAFKETHISRVYLTDTHAYKLKKPLNLGFLDFSSLERRHHFCNEEVNLNRRFTTGVYLGVVELRQRDKRVSFGGRGKVVDYAVKMRRLPEDLMLDRMIETNSPDLLAAMPQLGLALHRVMEQAYPCRDEPVHNLEVVKRNCAENFSQTQSAIGMSLTSEAHKLMQLATQQDLKTLAELMFEREAKGFVKDGHGDLHAANICMTDPICIYDCIEFNRRFRVADTIADLAFLIMDLEFRGRRDLADALMGHYQERSGDKDCIRLLPFYKQYRAWVRGKVSAVLATDTETTRDTRIKAIERARGYFNLALGYRLKPTLFIVSGLMGVGKTTLASALAHATGAQHLRSDVIRKQLAGLPQEQPCLDAFRTGLYSAEMTQRTYQELLLAAQEATLSNRSVVVDASFADDHERKKFTDLANLAGQKAWLLSLECPEDVTLSRLDQRIGDASDGRRELYSRQKASFGRIAAAKHVVTVDTTQPVDYNVQSILCRILSDQEQLT